MLAMDQTAGEKASVKRILSILLLLGGFFIISWWMLNYVAGVKDAGAVENWYDDNWLYRKKITIDYTKVAGNLTDFPVLINLASDAGLVASAQDDGDDILFTLSDKTAKGSPKGNGFCRKIYNKKIK
jgi:hypothetical protein